MDNEINELKNFRYKNHKLYIYEHKEKLYGVRLCVGDFTWLILWPVYLARRKQFVTMLVFFLISTIFFSVAIYENRSLIIPFLLYMVVILIFAAIYSNDRYIKKIEKIHKIFRVKGTTITPIFKKSVDEEGYVFKILVICNESLKNTTLYHDENFDKTYVVNSLSNSELMNVAKNIYLSDYNLIDIELRIESTDSVFVKSLYALYKDSYILNKKNEVLKYISWNNLINGVKVEKVVFNNFYDYKYFVMSGLSVNSATRGLDKIHNSIYYKSKEDLDRDERLEKIAEELEHDRKKKK